MLGCQLLPYFPIVAALAVSAQVTVDVPLNPPSSGPLVSGSLVALSIEQHRWLDWSGEASTNDFFFNALDNLKSITGEATRIRIGADSEDHTNFNPGVQVCTYHTLHCGHKMTWSLFSGGGDGVSCDHRHNPIS